MSYEVMEGQAGDRFVVTWKMRDQGCTRTTHFADFAEFMDHRNREAEEWGDFMEWYQVKGSYRVVV